MGNRGAGEKPEFVFADRLEVGLIDTVHCRAGGKKEGREQVQRAASETDWKTRGAAFRQRGAAFRQRSSFRRRGLQCRCHLRWPPSQSVMWERSLGPRFDDCQMIIACYKVFAAADRTFVVLGNRVIDPGFGKTCWGRRSCGSS